jgi:cell division protein FtsZ
MVKGGLDGVETIAINTDSQALGISQADVKHTLGELTNSGQGAGAKPEVGRDTALDDYERLETLLEGSDMVFIAAGMGGGTGTGASPIVAQVAKSIGALTVAVVTKPLSLERKDKLAEEGIKALRSEVDSLITIPNQKLSEVHGGDCDFIEAFAHGNDVLLGAVRGISDIITKVGTINVDFQDVKTVMSEQGTAMMGTGIASGPSRALEAASAAVGSPLLEDINLQNARGVLVNITGGEKVSIGEIEKVLEQIDQFAAEDAMIIHGVAIDDSMEPGDLKVTIVATGLGDSIQKNGISPDSFGLKVPHVSSINTVKPISSVQDVEREVSLDYLDVPSFVKRQID